MLRALLHFAGWCLPGFLAVLLLPGTGLAVAGDPPADRPEARPAPAASGTLHGLEQARVRADGGLVVPGRLHGHGRIDVGHVVIEGTLAPGDSPGCINFGGNVTLGITATLLSEIGGTTPCTQYDRITVAGTLTISGATLEIVLINGFTPQFGDVFDIMDWSGLNGSFGTIDTGAAVLPAPLAWDTSQLYLDGTLRVGVVHLADADLAPWDAPDGQLNAADVLIATQLVLGTRSPGPLQFAHGDMDEDGDIDLADLLLINQVVLQ